MLNEFYRVAFRKKIYATISELQNDLDVWVAKRKGRTRADIVLARRRCKLSLTPAPLHRKNR